VWTLEPSKMKGKPLPKHIKRAMLAKLDEMKAVVTNAQEQEDEKEEKDEKEDDEKKA
jgi:hypothetical protein